MEQHDQAESSPAREDSAPNIVTVGSHTVTLHPEVPIPLGIAATFVIANARDEAIVRGELASVYLKFGIESWTFPDPINPDTIAKNLPFADGGLEVAEAAGRLYTDEVMRPFHRRFPTLFPATPQDESTSVSTNTGSPLPTPSEPSSPTSSDGSPSEVPVP